MLTRSFFKFNHSNRRLILLLVGSHLLWSFVLLGFWSVGQLGDLRNPWSSGLFMALQLFVAAQLLLPAQALQPEERSRVFYLFWGIGLALLIWFVSQWSVDGLWRTLLASFRSGLLLLVATLIGSVLSRYVKQLWEIVPICLAMTLADFFSWLYGPTAGFARQLQDYYLAPEGPPPLIDMLLIKLALPGTITLAPVFGISDWIMVVFFASVARQHGVNDNLFGVAAETPLGLNRMGRYLPVPVAALFLVTLLAQLSGLFIPALPLIALIMFLWYVGRYLWQRI